MNKEQKKAKTVEIDSNKTLSFSEFDDLLRHARNSSLWYVGRFPSHSTKLKKRLYEKGYPEESVSHENSEGVVEKSNIVDLAMEELQLLHMIDDQLYIESKLKTEVSKGKGLSLAVRELKYKGIPEEEIDTVLENIEDSLDTELFAAVQKAAEKAMRSTPFRKAENGWRKSMIVSGALRAKGFDRDTVDNWMESNSSIFED